MYKKSSAYFLGHPISNISFIFLHLFNVLHLHIRYIAKILRHCISIIIYEIYFYIKYFLRLVIPQLSILACYRYIDVTSLSNNVFLNGRGQLYDGHVLI